MKDKVIGLKINITGTSDVIKKIADLAVQLERSKLQTKQLEKALTEAVKKNNVEDIELYTTQLANAKAAQQQLKAQSTILNKELALQQKAFRAAASEGEDSYKALDAQLAILRDQYKKLGATERASGIGQELEKNINALNAQLVEQDARLGIFSRNVGNYEDSVVRALRRFGSEEQIQKKLTEINQQTDTLKGKARQLFNQLEKGASGLDVGVATKELAKLEQQIEDNEKAAKQLNAELANTKKLGDKGGGFSARTLRRVGKVGGIASELGLVGDIGAGLESVKQFGTAGVAAFGIFAAGGLAVKAISVLNDLQKQFADLTKQTAAYSGASGVELDKLVTQSKSLADTFGKDQNEILKTTQQLSKNLGVDFATALNKVEAGLMTGADASGELLGALEGAADGARKAGLSIDDLITFANKATQDGLLSNRGLEIVNTFGEAVRTNSDEARAALENALGAEFTTNLFDNVQNGSLTTKEAIKQVSQALTEQGVSAEQASKVFVEAFGAQTAAENQFVLNLKDVRTGVLGYIDQSSKLTISQQEALKANKELASAQLGLAKTFEGTGFNIETLGTKIKTGLINFVKNATLAFDAFGSGLAAGREEVRLATEALEDQRKVVDELETNYTPLLNRYDELTAKIPTLTEGSKEAQAAQTELASIIQIVGERIPMAVTEFGAYSEALSINADAARGYIAEQREIQKILEQAQADEAIKQLERLRAEQTKLQEDVRAKNKDVELSFTDLVNPIEGAINATRRFSGEKITLDNKDLINAGKQLQAYGKEIKDLEALLSKTESGRAALGIGVSQDLNKALAATVTGNKKLADEAANFNSQQAQKNEEAAKQAAEAAKKRREDLIEAERTTREALEKATTQTTENIESLSIAGIEKQTEREIKQIEFGTQQRIKAESEALQEAAIQRIKLLGELAKSTDPAIRKQFGTPEQITQQANQVAAQTEEAIKQQTALILKERDAQIKQLQASRDAAIKEAAQSIDQQALQNAITEVSQRLQQSEQAGAAIALRFDVKEAEIESAAKKAKSQLDILRASGAIGEREYQNQLTAIDQSAQQQRIDLQIKRYDTEEALRQEQFILQQQAIEGALLQQQQAVETAANEQKKTLEKQLGDGLISYTQYTEAIKEVDASAAQQRISNEKLATGEINQLATENTNARIASENEITEAQLALFADRVAAYREQQLALLQEFAEGVQQVGGIILNAATIADNFATASDNNQKARIEERYNAELAGARGNATAIEQIERRKAEQLDKIEREAAARRKRIAIAQAIVNGAVAVTNILATTPDPTGLFTLFRIGEAVATTAAQVALISSQQYEFGGVIPSGDGFISGRSHKSGGVHGVINNRAVEVEGGEFKGNDERGNTMIINRKSSHQFRGLLESIRGKKFAGKGNLMGAINSYNGWGVPFFASGGSVPPTVQIGTTTSANNVLAANMERIEQTLSAVVDYTLATNNRIDNFNVIADAQEIVKLGVKNTPTRQAQEL